MMNLELKSLMESQPRGLAKNLSAVSTMVGTITLPMSVSSTKKLFPTDIKLNPVTTRKK